MCEILYIDSHGMLVLKSIIASHYYSCCIHGSTSPEIMDTSSMSMAAVFLDIEKAFDTT
jgi:hypothetical protein